MQANKVLTSVLAAGLSLFHGAISFIGALSHGPPSDAPSVAAAAQTVIEQQRSSTAALIAVPLLLTVFYAFSVYLCRRWARPAARAGAAT